MKINKIDHICVAVRDLAGRTEGLGAGAGQVRPDETTWTRWPGTRGPLHDWRNGPRAHGGHHGRRGHRPFIETRGEGIMLMGLNVDSARQSLEELKSAIRLISDPTYGEVLPSALNCEYGFVHPKASTECYWRSSTISGKTQSEGEEPSQAYAGHVRAFGAFIKLCRATWTLTGKVAASLPGQISFAQFAVLEALDSLGPMNQRTIAQKILRSSASVNVVVDNLDRRGLVTRSARRRIAGTWRSVSPLRARR